jgi:penicillin-binding protein 1A
LTGEGEDGGFMEAFKPGTGPADSYWVIGLGTLEEIERAREISPQASDAITSGGGGLY